MSDYHYPGNELELFSQAVRWKAYWSGKLSPYVGGAVLDVGAGQGNNLGVLLGDSCTSWTALEPDEKLLEKISQLGSIAKDSRLKRVAGTTFMLLNQQTVPAYDSIIYIDVMEHIEDDAAEFQRAARLLKTGGHLIILSPAHPFLYSPFDAAVGHFRRYKRSTLTKLSASDLTLETWFFMDSAGFLLSAANRLFLRQSMPGRRQIALWDNWIVPVSRVLDKVLGKCFGRSIVAIWRKN